MDVNDPFMPAFPTGDNLHVELPEQWVSPFAPSTAGQEPSEYPVEGSGGAPRGYPDGPAEGFDSPTEAVSTVAEAPAFPAGEPVAPAPAYPLSVGETEPTTAFGTTEPPATTEAPPAESGLERVKDLAQRLSGALQELEQALTSAETERAQFIEQQSQMQERITALEVEAEKKQRFKEALTTGAGATLTVEDLDALKSMTDGLNQDPDRLTILFNVVQHATKLATIVSVYGELRHLAEEL